MSSIVTAITGGGGAGDAYKPSGTNILQPANTDQANMLYNQSQQGINGQQSFLQALQAQHGIQNQANVFNQLQGVANGTGPNPAKAQLAQATGANVANQAALAAGQRGAGSNAGLIARQAAMQGAGLQQQAAGQAATLQANQSLNTLNQLGALSTNQVQQQQNAQNAYNQAAQGEQQNILGAIGAQNNANIGMQSNLNNVSGQLANTVSGQQADLIGNLAGGAGSALISSFADGGEVEDQSEPDSGFTMPSSPLSDTLAGLNAAIPASSLSNGPTSAVGQHFMNQQDASKPDIVQGMQSSSSKPKSALGGAGNILGKGMGSLVGQGLSAAGDYIFGGGLSSGFGALAGGAGDAIGAAAANPAVDDAAVAVLAAKGGKVKALLSPGEKYLPPSKVDAVAKGKIDPMKAGKTVPGKPKIKGAKNSYANDIVPAELEEGGIVLPRSVTQSKNPEWAAHKFVLDVMAKKGLK